MWHYELIQEYSIDELPEMLYTWIKKLINVTTYVVLDQDILQMDDHYIGTINWSVSSRSEVLRWVINDSRWSLIRRNCRRSAEQTS